MPGGAVEQGGREGGQGGSKGDDEDSGEANKEEELEWKEGQWLNDWYLSQRVTVVRLQCRTRLLCPLFHPSTAALPRPVEAVVAPHPCSQYRQSFACPR